MNAVQYETAEWRWQAPAPSGSQARADLTACFRKGGKAWTVRGFYAGNGCYQLRFLPEETGEYQYSVTGLIREEGVLRVLPAGKGRHGPVRARGIHLYYADGTPWVGLGTTVYAFFHQEEKLIDQTMDTLRRSPFTKVRLCVFPKHYRYNHNEPKHFAFCRDEQGRWDPHKPDFAFWDAFEKRLRQLDALGIQADLILFHPYDRWGLASLSREQNLTYLDYLLRRLSALPNVWWSLANEYDLCAAKSMEDWHEIEDFVRRGDPFGHLLGCHNCFLPYDPARPGVTHLSWQTKQLSRIPEMQRRYGKPVLIDECCYEGDLPETWGALSGAEMTARFWRTALAGGYCTHGETFYPDEREIVWWAKGGALRGESPDRIAFLKSVLEELPGPLTPLPQGFSALEGLSAEEIDRYLSALPEEERFWPGCFARLGPEEMSRFLNWESGLAARCGSAKAPDACLWYLDINRSRKFTILLPENGAYRVDILDTWQMTRQRAADSAAGEVTLDLPGRPWMAVAALREK